MTTDYKSTLTLPETKFPMRANLATREVERLAHWEKLDIYGRLMRQSEKSPKYILHDGPPFTNGDVHMGHLSNRNLKDIVLRYKAMRGFHTPMIPGWDCHGLPIEQKVMKEVQAEGKTLTTAQLRERCRAFSEENIAKMTEQFRRQGLLADWTHAYKTMAPAYEATTIRALAAFVEQGLVYRAKKSVMWSIPFRTALAEAEIEYHEHVSPSVWVPFFRADDASTAFVIWTTTPWTLPSNRAVALHPRLEYATLQASDGKKYIVAATLAQKFAEVAELKDVKEVGKAKGETFAGAKLVHPFMQEPSQVVMAEFVSAEDGTGCVHIAPGHGQEDYALGVQLGLEVYSPISDEGKYMDDGRVPAELVGLSMLEKNGKSEANEAVIALLKKNGRLLAQKNITHQYPFCWRSKTPIIFRAVPQWFVGLDRAEMRKKVLDAVETAKWLPPQGKNRIRGSIESRPDWCISRQRAWGVPIVAFVKPDGERVIDAGVIRALADKVAQHGTNILFEWSAEKILEGVKLPAGWNPAELKPETDTLDVWIESASSSLAVLKDNPQMAWPADLYLEGSDQHRGWFQSSLWISVVATGQAPYKKVLTHGFIVDADREKLSKSKGALPATEMIKKYGADVLRLWTASLDYSGDVPLSEEILTHVGNAYMALRNTLRYQLANLNGFDPVHDALPVDKLMPVDKWVVGQLITLIEDVTQAYERFDFANAYQLITRFGQVTLSSVYHDIIKDRMYTCAARSEERRSAQTAMQLVFDALVRMLAPIMPFTADEAWSYRKTDGDFCDESVHLQRWPTIDVAWMHAHTAAKDIEEILKIRAKVNEALEALRKDKTIGKSLEAKVTFTGKVEFLEKYEQILPELFIVSQVELQVRDGQMTVTAAKADGYKCPRCWRVVAQAPDSLCVRCQRTLNS